MDTTDKPREILTHQSANRPNLLLGGDRELVLVMVMIAGGLAFSLASWWGIGLAGAILGGPGGALAADGQGGPTTASCLPPAHPVRRFLSSKERSSWPDYRNAEWLEVSA